MKQLPKAGEVKALSFDLDGTIVWEAVLDERTAATLRRCAKKGLKIILNSGRSPDSAEKYRSRIGADGPCVYFNGALMADMSAGFRVINRVLLPDGVLQKCAELAEERVLYNQSFFAGPDNDPCSRLYGNRDCPESERYYGRTGLAIKFGGLSAAQADLGCLDCLKTMLIGEPAVLDAVRPVLEAAFPHALSLVRSTPAFLEITAAASTKGAGLVRAAAALGVPMSSVMAFGDEENDLSMLNAAAWAVVPQNAVPAAKEVASFVAGPCAEDGIAKFLEDFF
jgi:Cof subfamily protein (haloacid dehalogenase superfamily)